MICVTNTTPNTDISVRGKTVRPGMSIEIEDEVADQPGVVAFIKKGWLKTEMVKSVPDAVSVPKPKVQKHTEVATPAAPVQEKTQPVSQPVSQ